MPKPTCEITYIEFDGTSHTVEMKVGRTVMEGASRHMVPGITAECGGSCQCSTCHVYVDPAWIDKVGVAAGMEREMLDYAGGGQPNSRLSCQIKLTEALDGLVVSLPETQNNIGGV